MSNLKKFGALLAAVFALTAIAASSASAQTFTASAEGLTITGTSNTAQVFNTTVGSNLNKVTCNTGTVHGSTKGGTGGFYEQTVTVNYSSSINAACAAFIGNGNVSPAFYTFTLTKNNNDMNLDSVNVDIENSINISTNLGCNVQVPVQTVGTVTFANDGANRLTAIASVSGITSTGNGGICGNHHESGSYVGTVTVDSSSTLQFDVTG